MTKVTPETIQNSPYSEWLEELVSLVFEHKPRAMAAVLLLEDGSTLSDYYKAQWMDRLMISGAVQTDAILLAVQNNGEEIQAAWGDDGSEFEEDIDE